MQAKEPLLRLLSSCKESQQLIRKFDDQIDYSNIVRTSLTWWPSIYHRSSIPSGSFLKENNDQKARLKDHY